MTDRNVFWFLARVLNALEVEVPEAAAELACVLDGICLAVTVDGETRWLMAHHGRCVLHDIGLVGPELQTRHDVLVQLLNAQRTLLDACTRDELMLRGAPAEVAAIHDAMIVFLQGTLRSSTAANLFEDFVGEVDRSASSASTGSSRRST